jgi:hypothetical protein
MKPATKQRPATPDNDGDRHVPTVNEKKRGTNSNVHALFPNILDSIPSEIRWLVMERNILKSEDPKQYDILLIVLAKAFMPKTALQWLDLKQLHDMKWEQFRYARLKSPLIDSAQKSALVTLLMSTTDESRRDHTPNGNVVQSHQDAVEYFTSAKARKSILKLLDQFGYSQATIDAVALTHRLDQILFIERMQMSNEARQYEVRRYLEESHKVIEHHKSDSPEEEGNAN